MTIIWAIIIVYMCCMIGIGLYAKTKIKDSTDYHLAGRRLGVVMLAGTLAATEIGGGSSIGVASKAYGAWGLSAGWYVVASGIGIFLVSFIAPYMRRAMATTVPEIIGRRYGTPSHAITSVLSLIALVALAAAQITATASVVNVLTGFNYTSAILISGVVVVFYTWLGGMWSVTLTDFVQFFCIVIGFAVAVPFALHAVNGGDFTWANIVAGWNMVTSTLPEEKFHFTTVGWPTIIGLIIMYFMSFSSGQEAVQRYYSARNEKVAVAGSMLCGVLMAVYAFIPAVLGLIALAVFPNIPANSALGELSVNLLPHAVSGVLLSAVISATLSSASGDLLGAASIFVKDIYKIATRGKEMNGLRELKMSRLLVLIMGVCAILIALSSGQIIELLVFAFTLRATGPFAAYIIGLLSEKVTKNAGFLSIIAGMVVGLAWKIYSNISGSDPLGIMSIVVGSVASLLVFYVVLTIDRSRGVPYAPSAYPDEAETAETRK